MRKAFFFALICGINSSTLAQLDVSNKSTANSDKWVMTANKLPGSTGRILIDNPAGSTWTIYIYAMADEKYITSYAESNNKGVFILAPGEYKITLNNVPVLNVPVQKGYDTKIKCGIFDTEDETVWYLHDETGDAHYTSGDKPQKLVLPVGTYTYKIGGSDQRVVVKEKVHNLEIGQATPGIEEERYWVITPLEGMSADLGRLSIYIPKDTTLYVSLIGKTITVPLFISDTITFAGNSQMRFLLPRYFSAGFQDIRLNRIIVFHVPIKPGKETRIKAGFLVISEKRKEGEPGESDMEQAFDQLYGNNDFPDDIWTWKINLAGQIHTGKKIKIFALPPGEYKVEKTNPADYRKKVLYKAVIKDGEWVLNGVKQETND